MYSDHITYCRTSLRLFTRNCSSLVLSQLMICTGAIRRIGVISIPARANAAFLSKTKPDIPYKSKYLVTCKNLFMVAYFCNYLNLYKCFKYSKFCWCINKYETIQICETAHFIDWIHINNLFKIAFYLRKKMLQNFSFRYPLA